VNERQDALEFAVWLLLYAHRHRSILGEAGHILLTPANQLMVMGLKTWSLSNPALENLGFYRPTDLKEKRKRKKKKRNSD
jgi:hypothetical protein